MIKRVLAALAVTAAVATAGYTASPAQAAAPAPTVAFGVPPVITATNHHALAGVAPKVQPPKQVPTSGGIHTAAFTNCPSAPCYFRAGGYTGGDYYGASSTTTVDWAYCPSGTFDPGSHCLKELDVQDMSSGSRNIVELGITSDYGLNGASTACGGGDPDPHLFVYYWVNGTGMGYNTSAFQRYTGTGASPYGPGDSVCSLTGLSKNWGIQSSGGNWWVSFDSKWIGYYPQTLWTSPTFTHTGTNGLNQYFWEVASNYSNPCADMGDGNQGTATVHSPYNATTDPSKIGSASTINSAGTAVGATLTFFSPATTNYTLAHPSAATMYGGGPGWSSTGGSPGATDAC